MDTDIGEGNPPHLVGIHQCPRCSSGLLSWLGSQILTLRDRQDILRAGLNQTEAKTMVQCLGCSGSLESMVHHIYRVISQPRFCGQSPGSLEGHVTFLCLILLIVEWHKPRTVVQNKAAVPQGHVLSQGHYNLLC